MLLRRLMLGAAFMGAMGLAAGAAMAAPKVVAGPGHDPECFKPWNADTKYLQWDAKHGPYRIALVNGFVGNTWRIQMIQTAKAFAETAGHQGEDQGVQGRLHRHRRRGPARRHRGLHQPGLRRDRHHRGQPRGLRPGDPAGRPQRRGHRAVRQHPRHRQGDDGQRGPVRDGRACRPSSCSRSSATSATARSSRCAACPATRSTATGIVGFREVMEKQAPNFEIVEIVGNWDDGTVAEGRPPTPSPCTASSTACSPRAAPPARCAPSWMPAIRWCRWRARARTASASYIAQYKDRA